jgi:hypothetical protein
MVGSTTSGEQLLEMQGTLKLSYPTLADLGCLLTHVDEHGCRGSVMFQYLPPETVSTWKRCLTPSRPVRIKIESHPSLGNFEIDGLVSKISELASHSEIDLRFSNLNPHQRELLRQAVGGNIAPPQHPLPITPGVADTHTAASAAPAANVQPVPAAGIQMKGGGTLRIRKFEDSEAIRLRRPPSAATAPVQNAAPVAPTAPTAPPPPPPPAPAGRGVVEDRPRAIPLQQGAMPAQRAPASPQSAPISAASAPPPEGNKKRIGAVLTQMGYLTEAQIDDAVKQSRIKGQRLGRYLVGSGLISPDILCRALALQSGLPVTDLTDVEISDEIEKIFPFAMLMRHSFVPFDDSAMFICIAVATPLTHTTLKELERTCHKKVEVFLAREDSILKHLNDFRKRQQGSQPRRFLRYDLHTPVSYQFCSRFAGPTEETIHRGSTQNISEGGMLVVGPGSQLGKPDDLMRRGICLRITVHNEAAPQNEINALCRFKAIQEKNSLWHMGLELLEISTEDRRRLKELCVKAMIEQMKHKK